MKKNYESLLVNVIRFQAQDIITASGVTEEPKDTNCVCGDSCHFDDNLGKVHHYNATGDCTADVHTCGK